MSMSRNNAALVADMMAACKVILGYVQNSEWDDFADNKMLQDAVLYEIAVLGEAANSVTRDYADGHPEIPWASIAGMRHRIIHDYGQVNLKIVWNTVTIDIPAILAQLSALKLL